MHIRIHECVYYMYTCASEMKDTLSTVPAPRLRGLRSAEPLIRGRGICVHLFAIMVGPGHYSLSTHICLCNILCRIVGAFASEGKALLVVTSDIHIFPPGHIYIYIYIYMIHT